MKVQSAPACSRCGTALGPDAPEGLCPRCLLGLNLERPTEAALMGPNGTVIAPERPRIPSPNEIAAHFPQLQILECLGRGGMGVVYKARQVSLNRLVALKLIVPERKDDPSFAERFLREAQALAHLSHQNIVTVHDFGQTDELYYLIMEFVDGVSLRELLREGKLAPEQAMSIVPRICEALQYAHEQGVVHRDIKPENLLLDCKGQIKIADFGIAKVVGNGRMESLTAEKQVIGTPHYMAPEQVEAPQRVDHRADIYSLGVVFYEMLTGELPLGKFQAPSKKVHVDVRLDEVVLKALEKEPERRYQHASEVKQDVETIATSPAAIRSGRPSATEWKENAKDRVTRAVPIVRWIARGLGTVSLLFYGIFIVAEGLPVIAKASSAVQLNFAALALLFAGYLVGWGRDGAAAVLITSGWALWQLAEGSIRWNLFQTPMPIAALYAWCWWAKNSRNTARLLTVCAVVTVFLAAGLLTRTRVPGRARAGVVSAAAHPDVAPVVVRTMPPSGATGVDPALREVRVTFSERMQPGTWSWVQAGERTKPEFIGQTYFLPDGRTCVLPVRLRPGQTCALWINTAEFGNFRDGNGNSALPYLLIFETAN